MADRRYLRQLRAGLRLLGSGLGVQLVGEFSEVDPCSRQQLKVTRDANPYTLLGGVMVGTGP